MASDVSGMTSYTSKERELVKMQAEVSLQEEVTRLAQKRLAMKVLEAEIHSASNRSVRSCENMRSPEILSPPLKMHKAANGSGGPPDDGPNGNDDEPEEDSCPSTVYKPSPSPSPSAPIVEEASTTTSRIELPINTLNEESLRRPHLFPQQAEEFNIFTPVQSEVEKMVLAQQEFFRLRLMQRELGS